LIAVSAIASKYAQVARIRATKMAGRQRKILDQEIQGNNKLPEHP
jgi:hypothetical protein